MLRSMDCEGGIDMTCKECLHYDVCKDATVPNPEYKGTQPDKSKECRHFKNKADYAEEVRCKDCKYSEIADNGRFRKKIYCFQPAPIKQIVETEENRFCSYGERKDEK